MYPKSKSPPELKYERLRGMCGGTGENVRYIPIDNGIQRSMAGHGGIWLVLCVYRYTDCMAAEGNGIPVYDMRTQYTTAITRASQRPGACIVRACVRVRACVILLYYYNIIILLYYYIYIYPIYPIYPVYLTYPIYPTMVI